MANTWDVIENDDTGSPLPLAIDSRGVRVYCSREVWREHILLRHPEIELFKDVILDAIQAPDDSDIDAEDARVTRYYARIPNERLHSTHTLWLRVAVKYVYPPERQGQRTGLLSSVYLVRRSEKQ